MKILLVLALLSTFTVVVKGKKSHMLVTGLKFLEFSPGVDGAVSLRSSTGMPGWRSIGTNMQYNRRIQKMEVHCGNR